MDRIVTHKGRTANWIIIAFDCICVVVFLIGFEYYFSDYKSRLQDQNLKSISTINASTSVIGDRVLEDKKVNLGNLVHFLNAYELTTKEALTFLSDMNSEGGLEYELIDSTGIGYYSVCQEDGSFYQVDYSMTGYELLQEIFGDAGKNDSTTSITPEFTGSYTGIKCFAYYGYVELLDEEGNEQYYTLMQMSRNEDFNKALQYDESYEGTESVLMDLDGNYIISNAEFKAENFFDFLYNYNDLSLDNKIDLQNEVLSKKSGRITYDNAAGEECVFAYSKLETQDWYCVTMVPISSFHEERAELRFTIFTVILFSVMLVITVTYLNILRRKLKDSVEHEKEANSAKTDFLSRMSHDIRTPLNGIIGMTILAQDEDNPPVTRKYLENIDSSSHFLLGLINDILDMNKVESGKMELVPEDYSGDELRRYVEAVFVPMCQARSIELVQHFEDAQEAICVDKLRYHQIVFNLMSNAVKFTDSGGKVEIGVRFEKREDGKFRVTTMVADTGIGMSEEYQKHMFDEFSQERQSSRSNKVRTEGSGLGLTIVKNLVKLMNGSIDVESTPGKGSKFTVIFDVDEGDKEKLQQSGDLPAQVSLDGVRVLVFEDHQINAMIAEKILQKRGVVVELANNGMVGFNKFTESEPGYYKALFMDIQMPILDGYEVTKRIRSLDRPDAKTIPIIAMTANAFAEDVKQVLDAGMNAHVAKPISPETLYETLERFV